MLVQVKGNRSQALYDNSVAQKLLGYTIWTGPPGTEGENDSFCGDSQELEFLTEKYTNLTRYDAGVCQHETWRAYLLTYELPDEPVATGYSDLLGYPKEQGQSKKDPPAKVSAKKKPAGSKKTKPAKKGTSSASRKSGKKS